MLGPFAFGEGQAKRRICAAPVSDRLPPTLSGHPSGPGGAHPPPERSLRAACLLIHSPAAGRRTTSSRSSIMPKLLPGTALALVLATPLWALAQTADTSEPAEEDQVPSITESQPGVTTGEELEEEGEGGAQTGATGSTGGAEEKRSDGDTAEGGMGGETSGGSGDSGGG